MMQCIAVDDEALALDLLEDNIRKIPFLNLIRRCKNAFEAQEVLLSSQVDLVFLDVQMPGMTGVQFLQTIRQAPLVIFSTAYEHFALDGFNLDIIDYLLKPVHFDRFLKAANKANEIFHLRNKAWTSVSSTDYVFVNADYNLVKVTLNDITYIEGLKDYIKIFLKDATRPIITRMSLKSMEDKLPPGRFIRVHKSYIVAVDKIVSIRKARININNAQLPISDHYKENLYRFLDSASLN
jgi:DNA-binding LytR/AlgR family response regulator